MPAVWIAALAVLSALLLVAAAIVIAEKRKCAALSRELKRTRRELTEAGEMIRACEEKLGEARENCRAEIAKLHSSISHGFRIPLAIMQGYADL